MGSAEALVLVGVESANGGELAPIGQVLGTLEQMTSARPDPAGFTASVQMLVEAGLVEYVAHELGLTPSGRKLLRRAGSTRDRGHARRVATLLAALDSTPGLGAPAPSLVQVRAVVSGAGLPEEDYGEYEDEYDEDEADDAEYDEDEDEDEDYDGEDDEDEEGDDDDEDEDGEDGHDQDESEEDEVDGTGYDDTDAAPAGPTRHRRRWFHFGGGRAAAD
jgi:hypothetical protein